MHKLFSFVLLLFVTALHGEIIEVTHMNEIHSYLKPDMLVIFDIDNTLIEPVQELGTNQWFENRIREYVSYGYGKHEALEKALREWEAIQNVTKVRIVEEGTQQIIENIQLQRFKMMGLTSRGLSLATLTVSHLNKVGIDLRKNGPTKEEVFFMNTRGVLFRGGILFTAGTHKGKALFKFLDRINDQPKSVLFINDKATHLAQIEETCEERGVPFIGLRYGYLDEKVKNFRKQIAEVQSYFFGHIMSDEAAERYLHEHTGLPN